jgi:FkbM family methyltransferase
MNMNGIIDQIISIANDAPKHMNFLEWVFGEYKHLVSRGGVPVVLYGTGNLGKDFLIALNNHKVYPVCFCNTGAFDDGSTFCDIPVISVEKLKQDHKKSIIVIASQTYAAEIKRLLLYNGFKDDLLLWCKDFDMASALWFTSPNQLTTSASRTRTMEEWICFLQERKDRIMYGYNLLSDEKSRNLFVDKLALMVAYENVALFKNFISKHSEPVSKFGLIPFKPYGPENYFYFNNDVYGIADGEIYMDVGAFDGDTVIEFVQACKTRNINYKHIYAFEPDPESFHKLVKNVVAFDNISCQSEAIFSETKKLQFLSSHNIHQPGSTGIMDNGDVQINATSIDDFLCGKEITLLKMDPPGNIMCEALKGAQETIRIFKPKIVVGAYHSMEAIFEVPIALHEICSNYKLYLRHNSWGVNETDLHAVI